MGLFLRYDHRIDFRDLNDITSLNSLSESDRSGIWIPMLTFVNALGPFQVSYSNQTEAIFFLISRELNLRG